MLPWRLKLDVRRLLRRAGDSATATATLDPVRYSGPRRIAIEAPPYPQRQWEEECFATFGEGRDPAPCPDCGRTGFFGPRVDTADRRYRQCRFCGFTQVVGERATRFVPAVHGCAAWPTCARAAYIWWVPSDITSFMCPYCSTRLPVETVRVTPPADDKTHPWWRVPQDRLRRYYLRFWENWEVTKGRVHL
jgi:DNA-directed RNA polymerase subunit RPC12/RpoP